MADKTLDTIILGAMSLKKAEKAIDKADKTGKITKSESAKKSFLNALMRLDIAADHLNMAIHSAESGDESTAVYYAEKAKVWASIAYKNAEWAIKEAERGDNK